MKKLFLLLGLLAFLSTAHAGTITFDSASTNSDITRTWLNKNYWKVYNEVNGALDGTNIADASITSADIISNTNPLVRDNYNIGEYVYSGLTIATSASLSSTITAGIAFIENDSEGTLHFVQTGATAKTFTASKDTWTYLSYTGEFYYNEQSNGAAQPSTPTNYMLIAKVVTNGTAVTSVTDYAQRTPTNLRIYSDLKNGIVLSRDITTATIVNVGRGEIELGTTGKVRRNTSTVNCDLSTTGRGGLDAGSMAAMAYYYLFAIPDDDTETAFDVIASLSSSDATGVTDERLIGWCYAHSASAISPDSVVAYRGRGGDAPNILQRSGSTYASTTGASYTLIPDMEIRFYSSGRPIKVAFDAPISMSETDKAIGKINLEVDGVDLKSTAARCYAAGANEGAMWPAHVEYITTPVEGEHVVRAEWSVENGVTLSQDAPTLGNRLLIMQEM